jgi:hypothetical protein
MAVLELQFQNAINTSLQVGDIVYYCNPVSSGKGNITTNTFDQIIKLGDCSLVSSNSIRVQNVPSNITAPGEDSFILFSKDNEVNLSTMKGYFAKVELRNNSTSEAELFSINVDAVESSK